MLPLSVNPPVAVVPFTKQGDALVKFRFVMLRLFPLLCARVSEKLKTGDWLELELTSDAVQFPLMLPLSEFVPQPTDTTANASKIALKIVFTDHFTPSRRLVASERRRLA